MIAKLMFAIALGLGSTQAAEARFHPDAAPQPPAVPQQDKSCDTMTILHSSWNQTGTAKVFHYTRKVACS